MKIIRNIIVSFALYSKIPMPIFEWKKEDMEFNIAFLPLVGLVLGAVEFIAYYLLSMLGLNIIVKALIWIAIALLFTGGFHVDGFMDVSDALKSYKPKEEKLKILKDPHIGAFAVISLATLGCIYLASTYITFGKCLDQRFIVPAVLSFFLVRAVAGLLAVKLPHAKKEGMLHEETKEAKKCVPILLIVQIVIGVAASVYFNPWSGVATMVALFLFSLYFKHKCEKEFGGITGDCSGYFIVMGETIVMLILAVFSLVRI